MLFDTEENIFFSYLDDKSCVNMEFEMEGNPRAPRILLEHQSPIPQEAYIQKVFISIISKCKYLYKLFMFQAERKAWHPVRLLIFLFFFLYTKQTFSSTKFIIISFL
jgi:hypothetical protein